METRLRFIRDLKERHPGLKQVDLEAMISPELLSDFRITVPQQALKQAQSFAKALQSLRDRSEYLQSFQSEMESRDIQDPGNSSILMSYDFHWSDSKGLQLIEINTNASFLALGEQMYKTHEIPQPVSDFQIEEIKANIEHEMKLQGKSGPQTVSIIDEKPQQQRLYIEFLVFQSWFQSWQWRTTIDDFQSVPESVDFIYNRYTDFYLQDDRSRGLRERFNRRTSCLSPNPFEYLLLADKQRMIEWRAPGFLEKMGLSKADQESILSRLPDALDLNSENSELIWKERKKFFMKPKRSFGAKQSYRGSSISRKTFDEIIHQDFIAQEFVPAPEVDLQTPDGAQNFKYDLRFYVYRDRVQSVVARVYQGQVTNLKTKYGGFAPVIFG